MANEDNQRQCSCSTCGGRAFDILGECENCGVITQCRNCGAQLKVEDLVDANKEPKDNL